MDGTNVIRSFAAKRRASQFPLDLALEPRPATGGRGDSRTDTDRDHGIDIAETSNGSETTQSGEEEALQGTSKFREEGAQVRHWGYCHYEASGTIQR